MLSQSGRQARLLCVSSLLGPAVTLEFVLASLSFYHFVPLSYNHYALFIVTNYVLCVGFVKEVWVYEFKRCSY